MTETNTQRAIGRLEGQVSALTTQVADLTRAINAQGDRQHESQTRLYKRLDEQAEIVAATTRRLTLVENAVKTISPMAEDFGRMKQRGLGAIAVVTVLWLAVGGMVTSGMSALWSWVAKAVSHGG